MSTPSSGSIEQMLESATETPESATDFFGPAIARTLPATHRSNSSVESGADGASRDTDSRRRNGSRAHRGHPARARSDRSRVRVGRPAGGHGRDGAERGEPPARARARVD